MGHLDGLRDFLHHKVFIIDGKTVVIGSFNFSNSADTSNDENLLIITDPAVAALFEQELLLIEEATAKTRQAVPCPAPKVAVREAAVIP
jgi:phosphatidylserine/phosphatidylglycerophosphate/cardiolipin synthase-like enzyme